MTSLQGVIKWPHVGFWYFFFIKYGYLFLVKFGFILVSALLGLFNPLRY